MSVEPARKDLGVWYNPLTWPGDIANSITWLGIPAWVWLIGAGAITYILVSGEKKQPLQTGPTNIYIPESRIPRRYTKSRKKVKHGHK